MTDVSFSPYDRWSALPPDTGLYRRDTEKDACGVAMVATMRGHAGHDIIDHALLALANLDHRGATGAEPDTGDGAGILVQVPDRFLRSVMAEQGVELPPEGAYAVGTAFLPADAVAADKAQAAIESIVADEGLTVVAWRTVPVLPGCLGATSRAAIRARRTSSGTSSHSTTSQGTGNRTSVDETPSTTTGPPGCTWVQPVPVSVRRSQCW